MLQSIHIQNFRCFEDFKADGFERINLIGGKNNSGKSCLLEGILCLNKSVFGFVTNPNQKLEGFIWELRNELPKELININNQGNNHIYSTAKTKTQQIVSSHYYFNGNSFDNFPTLNEVHGDNHTYIENIFLIKQNISCPKIEFNDLIYKIEKEDKLDEFVKIFKEVDESILKLRTIGKDGSIPQIKQKHNSKFIFISSLGDAVNCLLKYFAPIIERLVFEEKKENDFILLIDEIENGIHYTAHKEFWQHLFKLCKELNVQVFATTHSLEMIKAFNEVALQEGEAGYFEMVREPETNNIKIAKHHTELLQYELNKEEQIRGEY